jgi:hypothetical protein
MQSSIEQQAISLIDRKKRLSKAKMREYLLNPNEYDTVLTILHTKVEFFLNYFFFD